MLDRLEKEQQQQQEAAAAGGGKDPRVRLSLCVHVLNQEKARARHPISSPSPSRTTAAPVHRRGAGLQPGDAAGPLSGHVPRAGEAHVQEHRAGAAGGRQVRPHAWRGRRVGHVCVCRPWVLPSVCTHQSPPTNPPPPPTRSSLDSGLPYLIRGMYHLNCPPPLKSVSKARQCFHKALQVRARLPAALCSIVHPPTYHHTHHTHTLHR